MKTARALMMVASQVLLTDKQIQNFHSCRRTGYRPMMTILASRERFCLHPDIATAPNKTEACEGATMVGHMDCSYLENAEASWYPQVQHFSQSLAMQLRSSTWQ